MVGDLQIRWILLGRLKYSPNAVSAYPLGPLLLFPVRPITLEQFSSVD